MNDQVPVLITCVGGTMVPSAIRWLRDHSRIPLRLFGVDANPAPVSAALLDGFDMVPMGDDPGYVQCLLDLVKTHRIKVLIPWSDGEAFALSKAADEFEKTGCALLTSPAPIMDILRDKVATYRKLKDSDVATPDYSLVHSPEELHDALKIFSFPESSVIIKPAAGRGGRHLFVLEGKDRQPDWLGSGHREKRLAANSFDPGKLQDYIFGPTMVMPCLGEPVYDADILAKDGKLLSVVIRRRQNPTGIPWTGNTICRNPAFENYARAAAEALGLSGAHDMDLMSMPDGGPALLEVNPRMSGSLPATLAAGIPFLDAAIGSVIGIDLDIPLPEKDVDVLPFTEAQALL